MSKLCSSCGKIISEKRWNRHHRKRCGVLSVKRFFRIFRKMSAGRSLALREARFLKSFMESPQFKINRDRILAKAERTVEPDFRLRTVLPLSN